jgi:hypothetical protein
MDAAQRLEPGTIDQRLQVRFDVRRQRATNDAWSLGAHLLSGHLPPALHHSQGRLQLEAFFELEGANVHGCRHAA